MGTGERTQLALVQANSRLGDTAANLEAVLETIGEEVSAGSQLIVFPELTLSGYFLKDLTQDCALRLDGPELERLRRAAGSASVLLGLVLESPDFEFHNAAVLISGGEVQLVHRKVYLPTYGLFDEHRYVASGDRFQVVEVPLGGGQSWRLGVLICEDLWHPSAAYLLSRQRADLILCPSASPGRGVAEAEAELGSAATYGAMLRTYAELFTVFVAYCNRVGFEDGFHFWGGSRVLGPDGKLLAGPLDDGPGVLRCALDRRELRRARIAAPLLRDEREGLVRRQLERPPRG